MTYLKIDQTNYKVILYDDPDSELKPTRLLKWTGAYVIPDDTTFRYSIFSGSLLVGIFPYQETAIIYTNLDDE